MNTIEEGSLQTVRMELKNDGIHTARVGLIVLSNHRHLHRGPTDHSPYASRGWHVPNRG